MSRGSWAAGAQIALEMVGTAVLEMCKRIQGKLRQQIANLVAGWPSPQASSQPGWKLHHARPAGCGAQWEWCAKTSRHKGPKLDPGLICVVSAHIGMLTVFMDFLQWYWNLEERFDGSRISKRILHRGCLAPPGVPAQCQSRIATRSWCCARVNVVCRSDVRCCSRSIKRKRTATAAVAAVV